MHDWPVDSAGDSTVIGELGIQAVGPTPGRAAYLLSETGKPSAPCVFHTGFLFLETRFLRETEVLKAQAVHC